MLDRIAPTKNVVALSNAFEGLATRDHGVPGMGLVYGYTGAGKTTAVAWLVARKNGVYVRANSGWTPTSMLSKIMSELGAAPMQRRAAMLEYIGDKLSQLKRPLFVDEADYLLHDGAMLESLRDVHDMSGLPVVLIGMANIEKKLVHRQQLARRISHWVEFRPSDLEDARLLTDTVAEVKVADDLVALLHRESKGSIGLMTVGLARIESQAKANGWKVADKDAWGNRALFLGNRPTER